LLPENWQPLRQKRELQKSMSANASKTVALKTLIDECVGLSRPSSDVSPSEVWFTASKEFRVIGERDRLKEILLQLLNHGIDSPDYRGVKVWISRSPVIDSGLRLGFRSAMPWPGEDQILQSEEEREWVHLEYEDENNVLPIRDFGGREQDQPKQGNYSVLWMDLKLCADAQFSQDTRGENSVEESNRRSYRILYIEDNSANLSLVETALTHRDHVELLKSGNAEDGIELAIKEQPNLILLDINLPGIDGYEALYRLSTNPLTKEIPVIAVSANAMGQDVERARKAGARDYLVKPYSIAKLFDLIDQWSGHACKTLSA
jgi:hypothetical protein